VWYSAGSHDADLVETVVIDADILRMNVKHTVGEVTHRIDVIHLLPNHMRRIVIQTEMVAGNVVKHPPPDGRADRQIFAAGPFIAAEQHGAVFDADSDVLFLGILNQRPPSFQKPWPVLIDGPGPVATDKCIHAIKTQQRRRANHPSNVFDG